MVLQVESRNWYRDEYLVSTERSLLQADAINEVLHSDIMWWANGLPLDILKQALDNSLCLGLYELPKSASEIAGQGGPKQIGLIRVVTDNVTFAYLTDVYVLPEYQGKGLAKWMLGCLNEVIKSWPHLRRFLLITSNTMELYRKTLGAKEFGDLSGGGMQIGMVEGPGAHSPDGHPH